MDPDGFQAAYKLLEANQAAVTPWCKCAVC